MDPQVEISRIKRRRMGLLALACLAAVAGYWGWRAWTLERWERALHAGLDARREPRAAAQRNFLNAACSGRTPGASALATSLPELLGHIENPSHRRALLKSLRAQLIEALDPGAVESRFIRTLEKAPTFFLQSWFDPLVGLGAWEFTRHLYDARGKVLLHFPASGYYEDVLDNASRLRGDLALYDYVLSLDLPPGQSSCEPTFTRALAGDFAARVIAAIEQEAGGPVRWLALRSEGRLAPLFAALTLPLAGQIELAGTVAEDEQDRAALALALLGERYLIVGKNTLGERALADLRAALKDLGEEGNLEVR